VKLSTTLSLYLARSYIVNFLFLLLGLLTIIYLFDTVELIRRAGKRDDVPISLILKMGLLKLPEVGQMLLPFAVLFSGIFTFWQLTRRSELVVVRSSGFSTWQFIAPIAMIALFAGLFQISIINPIGSLLVGKFEELERTRLSRQENQIALFQEGLWMRQVKNPGDQIDPLAADYNYVIIHAKHINPKDWLLEDVTALHFNAEDQFVMRADADTAKLDGQSWYLQSPVLHIIGQQAQKIDNYRIPTALTPSDIEESFASTASMSFWNLPSHIRTLEKTGFDATRLKVYHQSLMAQPLLFVAMVILAAAVSMRPPRSGGTALMVSLGIALGFVVFFLSSFLQAIGASGQIPTILAAWSAPIICLLLGIGTLLHLEEG